MKLLLILMLLIITFIFWLISTALLQNGKNTKLSFIIRSIAYWLAIIISFVIGIYCV